MAIVQDKVALELAGRIVDSINVLMDAFDEMERVQEQMEGAGITLAAFDEVISQNGDVQHASGAVYDGVLAQIATIVNYLKATTVSGKTLWNWWQSVRK